VTKESIPEPILRVDLITLFPEMLTGWLEESILGRARRSGRVEIRLHNLRDWGLGKHRTVDDRPFGGGPGMVLKPEPLAEAIESVRTPESRVIFMTPDGERLDHGKVMTLAATRHLVLVSGHYDNIDQRIRDQLIDEEISIGDYVLTNGTLPAAVLLDAVIRQIPGVLGHEESAGHDSFADSGLLGFPQYTRPPVFRGAGIPEVLLSGNHAAVEAWRASKRLEKTRKVRPDLMSSDAKKADEKSTR